MVFSGFGILVLIFGIFLTKFVIRYFQVLAFSGSAIWSTLWDLGEFWLYSFFLFWTSDCRTSFRTPSMVDAHTPFFKIIHCGGGGRQMGLGGKADGAGGGGVEAARAGGLGMSLTTLMCNAIFAKKVGQTTTSPHTTTTI